MNARYKDAWADLMKALDDTNVDPLSYVDSLEDMVDELRSRLDAGHEDLKNAGIKE